MDKVPANSHKKQSKPAKSSGGSSIARKGDGTVRSAHFTKFTKKQEADLMGKIKQHLQYFSSAILLAAGAASTAGLGSVALLF